MLIQILLVTLSTHKLSLGDYINCPQQESLALLFIIQFIQAACDDRLEPFFKKP